MLQLAPDQFEQIESNPTRLDQLLLIVDGVLGIRRKKYARYRRKQKDGSPIMKGTNGVLNPFEYYITGIARGYLGGVPPTFDVVNKDEESPEDYSDNFENLISRIQSVNDDPTIYAEVVTDYLVAAAAYLYVYQLEGQQYYIRMPAEETVAIWDYEKKPFALIRRWDEKDLDGNTTKVIEIITKERYLQMRRDQTVNSWQKGNEEEMKYKVGGEKVEPFVCFEQPDDISYFEPAIELIDMYEQELKNLKNMTEYNDMAKLMVRGYKFRGKTEKEKDKEVSNLLNRRVVLMDSEGDMGWLLKNVDYSGILDNIKLLQDNITMFTGVPNMTDQGFTNADNGKALGFKLYPLDQYIKIMDNIFVTGYRQLWTIIIERENQISSESYNPEHITIRMNRNDPKDKDAAMERASKAAAMPEQFSNQTVFEMAETGKDWEEEKARIEQQQQEEEENEKERIRNEMEDQGGAEVPFIKESADENVAEEEKDESRAV